MKEKKGISLIVLIVTIIVMIIIAGAVIISLTNDNIIDQATNATRKYNIAQLKEQINIENAMRESGLSGSYIGKLENGSLKELGIEDEESIEKLYIQNGNLVYRPENVTTDEADKYKSQGIEAANYIGVVNSDASLANYENTANIITASELQSTLENNRFANIVILEDITLNTSGYITYPKENGIDVGFAGIIDGMDYVMTRNGGDSLFYINAGIIKNIIIEGSTEEIFSGSLLVDYNNGTIMNCHNKANIAGWALAGIAGFNTGKILNCSNSGKLESEDTISGITNFNTGKVINCFNKGELINASNAINILAGGISAQSTGEIINCYNTADLSDESKYNKASGIVAESNNKVLNSYNVGIIKGSASNAVAVWDSSVNNYSVKQEANIEKGESVEWIEDLVTDGDIVTAADKAELLKRLNAPSSNNVWVEDTNNINNGYPILYWQAK